MSIKSTVKILVVDDEKRGRDTLIKILEAENFIAIAAADGVSALKYIKSDDFNLVLLDLILPGINGIEVLTKIKESHPSLPVVMISAHGTIKDAVEATKLGAYDFLEKASFDKERFLLLVRNALERERMYREIVELKEEAMKQFQMIGVSEPIKKIFNRIEDTAKTNATVLITGESGVGKELVARAIHNKSNRQEASFVKINCAAIPENLIESELFGYEKGAFTGAIAQKKGKLEVADKGTLFLDEIGDLGGSAQAKLLRFLQESEFERLGGNVTIKVDVRVIAATNKNLSEEIKQRKFRDDLYYRLNVINIYVPTLRERKEDIPVIADYFLEKYCEENGIPKKLLTSETMEFLKNLPWQGNVRELENLVKRATILIKSPEIMPKDLLAIMESEEKPSTQPGQVAKKGLQEATDDFQKEYILRVLAENNWNKTKAAEELKVERPNLHRKLKDLGIGI